MLPIFEFGMRALTMPSGEIQGTSTSETSRLGLLRNNDLTIKISDIIGSDCCSEVELVRVVEAQMVTLNVDNISLHTGKMEKR